MRFEEEHLDVLLAIETPIVNFYRKNLETKDKNVIKALEALSERCRYVIKGYELKNPDLSEPDFQIYQVVAESLDLRGMFNEDPKLHLQAVRKVLKSAKRWNKRNGIRGYLNFIKEFIPESA